MASKFSTHHIPDQGVRFAPGETVHVDRALAQVQIVKDPDGDYEVMGCRPATEFKGGTPLLRVDLKRIERTTLPPGEPHPWTPRPR
jgi:hypothetical protein